MKEIIHAWLNQIEKEAIIPHSIVALNFGLYETEKGYCIYLVGAHKYDGNDDSWAEDVENLPHEFFLEIEAQCDWRAFQKQIECLLSDELKIRIRNSSSPFFNKIVTCGFDDGILIRIA